MVSGTARPEKNPLLQGTTGECPLEHLGVHLLKETRNSEHDRGFDFREIPANRVEVFGVCDCSSSSEHHVEAGGSLERVRQRQHREADVIWSDRQDLEGSERVARQVAVREHHALGLACRAGSVDQGRQRVGRNGQGIIAIVGILRLGCFAELSQLLECHRGQIPAGVESNDVF